MEENDLDIRVPMFIRDIFQTYLFSFLRQLYYHKLRMELPLYQHLTSLKLHTHYYLKGNVIHFTAVHEHNLNLELKIVDRKGTHHHSQLNLKGWIGSEL